MVNKAWTHFFMHYLEGKTIFITGGTGFVGKSILDYVTSLELKNPPDFILNSRGTNDFQTHSWPMLKISHLISDLETLEMQDKRIDLFLHAATSTNPKESQNTHYLEKTLLNGTKKVLELCKKNEVKSLVYLSSGAVYGLNGHHEALAESTPLNLEIKNNPYEQYGYYKILGEDIIKSGASDLKIPLMIARLFAFSGLHLNPQAPFALTSFIKQGLEQKKIIVQSSGKAVRSYLSAKDLSHWLLTSGFHHSGVDTFNLGSEKAISIGELAHMVAGLLHVPVEFMNSPIERENMYVPNCQKIKKAFSLDETISLENQIGEMIRGFKN